MVLIPLVRDYIDRMLHDRDLLWKEVFLVETVDYASSSREAMAHLKAVYFLRPSSDNVQRLRRHLVARRFTEYHLFFWSKTTVLHLRAGAVFTRFAELTFVWSSLKLLSSVQACFQMVG